MTEHISNKVIEHESGDSDGEDIVPEPPTNAKTTDNRTYMQKMMKRMPLKVQNRIVALKNIQLDQLYMEAEFYEEIIALEKQYSGKIQPLFNERYKIISGHVEPPEQAPNWKTPELEDNETLEKCAGDYNFTDLKPLLEENCEGIPNFWLTIFRNSDTLSTLIQEWDEPLLRKLLDIRIVYPADKEQSFTLEFHFDKNDYFTNVVLTKKYFLRETVEEDSPFEYDGPDIYKCEGCVINWKKNMNLTVKVIHCQQRESTKAVSKQIPNNSFFSFFSPPELPEGDGENDEEIRGILTADYDVGDLIKSQIVPRAILYYTCEIAEDDDDFDIYDNENEADDEEVINGSVNENHQSGNFLNCSNQ